MSYLLDTNVLSETRRHRQNPGVLDWIASTPADRRHISVMTIGEIGRGIRRLLQRGDEQQAAGYAGWLDRILDAYGGRIVPVDLATARDWGDQSITEPIQIVDGLIAATAMSRGWTLVTRNVKHFERTGVRLLNPFSA